MAEPFIGQIMLFGGNFAPANWAFCQGQLLAISQYQALFSILGTMYGGNGTVNFALPDLRSKVAIGFGQGPGLSNYAIAQTGGVETVTLLAAQMPMHNHSFSPTGATATVQGSASAGSVNTPSGNYLAGVTSAIGTTRPTTSPLYVPGSPAPTDLANIAGVSLNLPATAIGQAGGSQPHTNIQPYLAMNYIIALQGIFPVRG